MTQMKISVPGAALYLLLCLPQITIAQRETEPDAEVEKWIGKGNASMQEARDKAGHDFKAAEEAFLKALALKSDSTEAMLGMAWVKNSEHLFEQGRGWAEKALAFDPRLADAHALLGDYAVERGEYDLAFDHYQAAIDIRADLSTYSRAAHLLWITGDTSKAQMLMEKAIRSGGPFPENTAWCRTRLAGMQFSLGAMLPAETLMKKALEEAPEYPHALAMMARIQAAKGSTDEAINLYEKSVSITPTHEALAALVDLYVLEGNEEKSEQAFENMTGYHRPDPAKVAGDTSIHGHFHPSGQASAEYAMFLAKHDRDLEEALKEAEKAYEIYKNINVEDTLAWCHYKLADYTSARRMIERATKWNTSEPGLYFHRGMIYAKLGESRKAAVDLNQALALNPEFDPLDADLARRTLEEITPKAVKKAE